MRSEDLAKAQFCRETLASSVAVNAYLLPHHMGLFYVPDVFRDHSAVHLRVTNAAITDEAFSCTPFVGGERLQIAIPWIAVYFLQCETSGKHCIDWRLLGEMNGHVATFAARLEYAKVLPESRWSCDVSVGPQIDFGLRTSAPKLATLGGVDNGKDAITRAQSRWGYAQSYKGGAQ